MAFLEEQFPMEIKISFSKLIEEYQVHLDGEDPLLKERAQRVIVLANQNPQLLEGLTSYQDLEKYKSQIDDILADLFSGILQNNEIKMASLPFHEGVIKTSKRYDTIIKAAGDDFHPELKNFDEDSMYIMGCSIILNAYYNYKTDFRRPFYYDIPDAQGMMRHYRLLYNGDYISIEKGPKTKEITQEDVAELLDNFENIALWKEKFPPRSWTFKGFVIANLYDATTDVSISDFKTSLLKYDKSEEGFVEGFRNIFRSIFNISDLNVGFSSYNEEDKVLERVPERGIVSFVLTQKPSSTCETALCPGSYHTIFMEKKFFAISDVEKYYAKDTKETFYKNLLDQNIKSAIFAPITSGDSFLGLLEIVSPTKLELNSVNANKLLDLMPYLEDTVLRSKAEGENALELIIQDECTSIHPSVYWKFRQEAKRIVQAQIEEDAEVSFRDIVFKDVYPLFGQIDIKGSSQARNGAVQKDLLVQLRGAKGILETLQSAQKLPVYEEFLYRLENYEQTISSQLEVDSEQTVLNFFNDDIRPLFDHLLETTSPEIKKMIKNYRSKLDRGMGLIYQHRKDFDDSVMAINKKMAAVLDKKQKEAQAMYPHFYERFKTDGVEHNMYIGESITREDSFNKIYLYNLRLWQLQAMCEMENAHYTLSRKLKHPLDVASMILVFNTSLSVRFRMDEKRFDVDGTYNARYEVVKKRVDKAYIKGTQQRVTQAGKIAIVYSQKEDEREYMGYVRFLQAKKYLGNSVEIVELEDLQAVTGLKAILVEVLYKTKSGEKKYYTYDDLMKELEV